MGEARSYGEVQEARVRSQFVMAGRETNGHKAGFDYYLGSKDENIAITAGHTLLVKVGVDE